MRKWIGHEFESSSQTTKEFTSFANDFKKHILKNLSETVKIITFNKGYFYVSGFLKSTESEKYVYFSISDVRYFKEDWNKKILIRTAKNESDYTGGANNYTSLQDFSKAIDKLIGFMQP